MPGTKCLVVLALCSTLGLMSVGVSPAADKLRFGSLKGIAPYVIPPLVADRLGFWKQNGLELELVPFRGGADMFVAVSARHIDMGISEGTSVAVVTSRGVPAVVVASLPITTKFGVWVRSDSVVKEPSQLREKRIGVVGMYDLTASLAKALLKRLGLEKDVKIVALGGIREKLAALKAGNVDAVLTGFNAAVIMKVKGEVRELLDMEGFMPQPWAQYLIFSSRDFVERNPEVIKKGLRSMLQTARFIRDNPGQVQEMTIAELGYPQEAARLVYQASFGKGEVGAVDLKGLENIRNFLMEYGVIKDVSGEIHNNRFIQEVLGSGR